MISKKIAIQNKNVENLTIPKYYYVDDIQYYAVYNNQLKNDNAFKNINKQGQIKLLLNEIRFLSEDIQIHNFKNDKFLILYIGSGKGYHIPYLINLYKKYNIFWKFYDPNGHCENLLNMQSDNIKIYNEYFTEADLVNIPENNRKIIFISDIRSLSNPSQPEPTTDDLLFDYNLQNNILKKLKPDFSLIKFRMPFPDQWHSHQTFYKPVGKEYIQAFSKKTSTEFRIFLSSIIIFKKISKKKSLIEYEEKYSWYNTQYRFCNSNDLIIAIHILNLYNFIEKNNIEEHLTLDNIIDFMKYLSSQF